MPSVVFDMFSSRRAAKVLVLRLCPLLAAVSLVRISNTSTLELEAFLPDRVLTFGLYVYALLLVAMAASPARTIRLHPVGAALAVFIIGGRVMAFVSLYLDGRPDLEGSVWERAWILVSMLVWHLTVSVYWASHEGQ